MFVKTLDRYIIRSFLHSLLMWFIVFMALRVVIDLFTNMDEFTEGDPTTIELIGNILSYYFFHTFVYFTEMGGLIIVAAAAFTMARMNHTNELTAMLASGVSLHRVVWPMVCAAMLMGGLLVIDKEFCIPKIRHKLVIDIDAMGGEKEVFQVQFLPDGNRSVWYANLYLPEEHKMQYPMVILRNEDVSKLRYLAHAVGREAMPGTLEDRQGWYIHEGQIMRVAESNAFWRRTQKTDRLYTEVSPHALAVKSVEAYNKKHKPKVPITLHDVQVVNRPEGFDNHYKMQVRAKKFRCDRPQNGRIPGGTLEAPQFIFMDDNDRVLATIVAERAEWVQGELADQHWKLQRGAIFVNSDLTEGELELRQSGHWLEYMSSEELTRMLQLKRSQDPRKVRMTKYTRVADPLNNLIMLLVGLPFILSRQRNIKASAGLCILMCGAFYVFIYMCRYIGLPDFLAAFLPVLLFGPISVIMLDSIKT